MRAFININRQISATFAGISRQITRVNAGIDTLAGEVRSSLQTLSLAFVSLLRGETGRERRLVRSSFGIRSFDSSWLMHWPVTAYVATQYVLCSKHLGKPSSHIKRNTCLPASATSA